jgi:hypothetical protein
MVCSISISIGMMVGFLDLSPCMNQTKFGSYSSFSIAVLMTLEQRLITEGCALDRWELDRTWAKIICSHRAMLSLNYSTQKRKQTKLNRT